MADLGTVCMTITREERVILTDTTTEPPSKVAIIEIRCDGPRRASIRITAPKTTRINREPIG